MRRTSDHVAAIFITLPAIAQKSICKNLSVFIYIKKEAKQSGEIAGKPTTILPMCLGVKEIVR